MQQVDCTIKIQNVRSFISGTYPTNIIKHICSYPVDGYWFSPLYKRHIWDGRKHLFTGKDHSFPTGLLQSVITALKRFSPGARILIEEKRVAPPIAFGNDLESINLAGITFGQNNYDYQLETLKA